MQKHYHLESIVDYARGLVDDATDRSRLEEHLASCDACRTSARGFARLAATPKPPEPPPEALAAARQIFRHPHPAQPEPSRAPVRLLFDSAAAPLLAGTRRGGAPQARRLLFEAGDFFLDIDVALEVQGQAQLESRTLVVGQLVDRKEPSRRLPGIPVILESTGDGVLGQASSNPLGEFRLECEPQSGLRLAIPVAGGKRIEVALPRPEGTA